MNRRDLLKLIPGAFALAAGVAVAKPAEVAWKEIPKHGEYVPDPDFDWGYVDISKVRWRGAVIYDRHGNVSHYFQNASDTEELRWILSPTK
jgi:hypothetical protein